MQPNQSWKQDPSASKPHLQPPVDHHSIQTSRSSVATSCSIVRYPHFVLVLISSSAWQHFLSISILPFTFPKFHSILTYFSVHFSHIILLTSSSTLPPPSVSTPRLAITTLATITQLPHTNSTISVDTTTLLPSSWLTPTSAYFSTVSDLSNEWSPIPNIHPISLLCHYLQSWCHLASQSYLISHCI